MDATSFNSSPEASQRQTNNQLLTIATGVTFTNYYSFNNLTFNFYLFTICLYYIPVKDKHAKQCFK